MTFPTTVCCADRENRSRSRGVLRPMTTRRTFAAVSALAAVVLGPDVAHAGAPNFTCRFGSLRIAADVQAGSALLADRNLHLRRASVPEYKSGGAGFTAIAGQDHLDVQLIHGGGGTLLQSAASTLTIRRGRSDVRALTGTCSAITGDHVLGALLSSRLTVRSARSVDAAPVKPLSGSMPFVWTKVRYVSTSPNTADWIAVSLFNASGSERHGYVRSADAGFVEPEPPGGQIAPLPKL